MESALVLQGNHESFSLADPYKKGCQLHKRTVPAKPLDLFESLGSQRIPTITAPLRSVETLFVATVRAVAITAAKTYRC
jgi:hypothetical protein